MVNASRKEYEISSVDYESNPLIGCILYPHNNRVRSKVVAVVIVLTMNIKETTSLEDIPDLLVFVHMPGERNVEHETPGWAKRSDVLRIEYLELCLVKIAERFFSDGHDINGLVLAVKGDGVDLGEVVCHGDRDGDVPEEDTDRSEGGVADGYAGVVGEALVAGKVVKVVGTHV